MSALALDWPCPETETATASPPAKDTAAGREAVFRSALESYLADYERHLAADGRGAGAPGGSAGAPGRR
jgi:hypothetical protein